MPFIPFPRKAIEKIVIDTAENNGIGGGGISSYATPDDLPQEAKDGAAAVVKSTDTIWVFDEVVGWLETDQKMSDLEALFAAKNHTHDNMYTKTEADGKFALKGEGGTGEVIVEEYDDTELRNLINQKAEVDHTHDDIYTKAEANDTFALKGEVGEGGSYDDTEIRTLLNDKADISHTHTEFYTKEESDGKYALKGEGGTGETIVEEYDDTELRNLINQKADATHTHDEYAAKNHTHTDLYTKTEADEKFALKGEGGSGTSYDDTELRNLINNKAEVTHTHDDMYTKGEVNDLFALKSEVGTGESYDDTEIRNLIDGKADIGESYTKLEADLQFAPKSDSLKDYQEEIVTIPAGGSLERNQHLTTELLFINEPIVKGHIPVSTEVGNNQDGMLAFDGDPLTYWRINAYGGTTSWLIADFGKPIAAEVFRFHIEEKLTSIAPGALTIEFSDDKATWSTASSGTNLRQYGTSGKADVVIAEELPHQYWKINIANGSNRGDIYEIQVGHFEDNFVPLPEMTNITLTHSELGTTITNNEADEKKLMLLIEVPLTSLYLYNKFNDLKASNGYSQEDADKRFALKRQLPQHIEEELQTIHPLEEITIDHDLSDEDVLVKEKVLVNQIPDEFQISKGWDPAPLFDGDITTSWKPSTASEEQMTISYDRPIVLDLVRFLVDANISSVHRGISSIQFSDNGVDWTDTVTGFVLYDLANNGIADVEVPEPNAHRFWRYVIGRDSSTRYIYEIQMNRYDDQYKPYGPADNLVVENNGRNTTIRNEGEVEKEIKVLRKTPIDPMELMDTINQKPNLDEVYKEMGKNFSKKGELGVKKSAIFELGAGETNTELDLFEKHHEIFFGIDNLYNQTKAPVESFGEYIWSPLITSNPQNAFVDNASYAIGADGVIDVIWYGFAFTEPTTINQLYLRQNDVNYEVLSVYIEHSDDWDNVAQTGTWTRVATLDTVRGENTLHFEASTHRFWRVVANSKPNYSSWRLNYIEFGHLRKDYYPIEEWQGIEVDATKNATTITNNGALPIHLKVDYIDDFGDAYLPTSGGVINGPVEINDNSGESLVISNPDIDAKASFRMHEEGLFIYHSLEPLRYTRWAPDGEFYLQSTHRALHAGNYGEYFKPREATIGIAPGASDTSLNLFHKVHNIGVVVDGLTYRNLKESDNLDITFSPEQTTITNNGTEHLGLRIVWYDWN